MKFSNNVSAAFSPGLHGQIFEPGNLIFLINFSRTESDEFIVLFSLSLLSISLNWKQLYLGHMNLINSFLI